MSRMTVGELAGWVEGEILAGDPGTPLGGVAYDSRQVRPGDCFVALPGSRVDGHDYVGEAAARGAACALVSRPVPAPPGFSVIRVPDTLLALGMAAARYRQRFDLPVVAVTGSVGKTTTKEMAAAVLGRRYRTLRNAGNLNSEVGLPVVLLNELGPEHEAAVLEMGMRGLGEIAYLCSIARPRVAVVTNVGPTHLELLGSIENIARAKAEAVQALPPDGVAVLNGDDPRVRAMAALAPGEVILYSLEGALGPRFVTVQHLRPAQVPGLPVPGTAFTLVTYAGEAEVVLPAPGRHHVQAALAAAGVGLALGLSPAEIAGGLAAYRPAGSRQRFVALGDVLILDDTYNAAPASVKAALGVLAELPGPGRRLAVLGDMYELGEYTEAGHREVGQAAAQVADRLWAVGELARWIAEGALDAGMDPGAVEWHREKGEAIRSLLAALQPGDRVLVKGSRGMRMEEIVAAIENHLSRLPDGR
nr:MAG: UDP-N-acetylmuramoyl-tripeptide--D-alanyl-D-alanine ligase [Bacillota bacterium]